MPRIFAKYDPNFPGDTKYHGSYSLNLITKQWEFKGYKCVHCDQIFKQNPTTGKHQNNCKGISRKKPKDEEDMPTLLDKRGKEWKPLETNQILSRTKPNYRDINK